MPRRRCCRRRPRARASSGQRRSRVPTWTPSRDSSSVTCDRMLLTKQPRTRPAYGRVPADSSETPTSVENGRPRLGRRSRFADTQPMRWLKSIVSVGLLVGAAAVALVTAFSDHSDDYGKVPLPQGGIVHLPKGKVTVFYSQPGDD